MKNNNLTLLDPNQISVQQHDPEHDAQRVIVVGSDSAQIANAVREGLKDLKIEVPPATYQITSSIPTEEIHRLVETLKKDMTHTISPSVLSSPSISLQPITIPEVQVVNIPTIVKETEIKVIEIERPIIIKEKELAFQRVEVPVIVKEIQPFPKILVWIFGLQALISLLTIFLHK